MLRNGTNWIVFSSLDGSLLDARGRWEPAAAALAHLRARKIPVVLSSGGPRAEVVPLREALGLSDPFVTESGGAVYIPRNYFPFALPRARVETGFQVLELGQRAVELTRALEEAAKTSGVRVRAFSRMKGSEAARRLRANGGACRCAGRREYGELFLLEDGTARQRERFFRWLQQRGLRVLGENHVHHLVGNNDQGMAVAQLSELYRQRFGAIRTVGLAQSASDLGLLRSVDVPVLVADADGRHDAEARKKISGARLAPGRGPAGWNQAVLDLLNSSR